MPKKAVIGLKAIHMAKLTTNTAEAYASGEAFALPYAGSLSRTAKEKSQEFYYDDDLYASVRDIIGEDVELNLGELSLELIEKLGLGTFDKESKVLEADFSVPSNSEYALRFSTPLIEGGKAYLWNYRRFVVTSVQYGNFSTKGDNITVCEPIIKGVFSRPALSTVKAFQLTEGTDPISTSDKTFLTKTETFPGV